MVSHALARLLALLLISFFALTAWWVLPASGTQNCQCLTISFLDVGQGDAIYFKTPDGFEMLVDGGRDSSVLRQLALQQSFFDRDIDVVVATHPDLDHIGGLIDVLERYNVDTILVTENQNDTPASAAFSEAVTSENAALILAEARQQFLLGASTSITILSPYGDETNWESNNASIVMRVSYGDIDILLTGDAPASIEEFIVEQYGPHLSSEILKLGHHGSRTSTSQAFLDTVSPQYAVVSAGIGNSYGHPHQEVMQRVFARNIQTFHTGTDGTVTFVSDGETVEVK